MFRQTVGSKKGDCSVWPYSLIVALISVLSLVNGLHRLITAIIPED